MLAQFFKGSNSRRNPMMTVSNYIICCKSCKMIAIKRNLRLFTAQFGPLHQTGRLNWPLMSTPALEMLHRTNISRQSLKLYTEGKLGHRVKKLVMICLVLVYSLAQYPTLHPPALPNIISSSPLSAWELQWKHGQLWTSFNPTSLPICGYGPAQAP